MAMLPGNTIRINQRILTLNEHSCHAKNLGFFRILTGVVVNDAPTLGKTLEPQREDSPKLVRGTLEMPSAKNESGVFPERMHLQFGKIKVPHCLPIGIVPLIAC